MAPQTNSPKAEEAAAPTVDYIEYLGEEPHGTAFLSSHTIPKGDGRWKRNKVDDAKDVTWERDPQGPPVGFKGNRFRVRVEDLSPAQVAVLEKTPGYKRVSE
jgi:hypothetical protein